MGQLTIRADDDLIFRVRSKAKESGRSMNEYIVVVLDAATNPASATT
jgi:predicted HicB family RNase H-like nuclease